MIEVARVAPVMLFGHDLGSLSVALRSGGGAGRACLRTLKALLQSKGRGRRRTVGLVAPGGRDASTRWGEATKKPGSCGPGLEESARAFAAYFRIISFTDFPAGIIGSTCSV